MKTEVTFVTKSLYKIELLLIKTIPLYYILVCDIINYYDYYIGIPVNARNLLTLNIIIFSIFMLLLVYFKFKQHESRTSK